MLKKFSIAVLTIGNALGLFGIQVPIFLAIVASGEMFPASAAHAASASKPASYCDISSALLGSSANAENLVSTINAKCHIGDLIQIPTIYTYVIAKTCDFNRTIFNGSTVVCVFAGERPSR